MKYLLIPIFFITLSCSQPKSENVVKTTKPIIGFDTTNLVIFPLDSNHNSLPFNIGVIFPQSYTNASLTDSELIIVRDLLIECIDSYNSDSSNEKIDLKKYKFQLVAAQNSKGEKEVLINSFFYSDLENFESWKVYFVDVYDGGSSNFRIKFKLNKRQYFDFSINSVA